VDKYAYIVNTFRDFITLINRDFVYEIVNDSYCRAMGKSREEILGRTVAEVWGLERFSGGISRHLADCFEGREVQYIERFRFGPFEKHMHVTCYPYSDGDEGITHAVVCSHDITHISQIESKLTHFEFKDPTTGLFNRKSLDIILDKEIEQAKRSADKLRAVIFVAVENLGKVNEVYGLQTGDLILENTGLRIQKCLGPEDFVFRFVGNELACLLTHIAKATDAGVIAARIVEQVKMPYSHRDGEIFIGCSVGISVYPEDGATVEAILRNATSALNQGRRSGSEFTFYNPRVHKSAVDLMSLEGEIHRAFEKEQFFLVYQPIVESSGRIKGAEALIRWRHPERGIVPPGQFIKVAEDAGIIRPISTWALFAAAEQLASWSARYGIYISVNLAADDFRAADLPDILESALRRSGVTSPGFLKLEITETQCMDDPAATIERMGRLTGSGFDIFIDDFGTGNSSLGYLKTLPAGTVKIDRFFVDESVKSPEDHAYVSSIATLARSRRKAVILEGIGTLQQYELLRRLGADGMQGFYFSKPLTAPEMESLLERGGKLPLPEGEGI
jgi:diguanylate cyclase